VFCPLGRGAIPLRQDAPRSTRDTSTSSRPCRAAIGFSARKDLLAEFRELILSIAQSLKKAETVIPSGIPATFPNAETLVSEGCICPLALA